MASVTDPGQILWLLNMLGAQERARMFARQKLGKRPIPEWLERRIKGFPILPDPITGQPQTVRAGTFGGFLAPTIREVDGELRQLSKGDAARELRKRKDGIRFRNDDEADAFYATINAILESGANPIR